MCGIAGIIAKDEVGQTNIPNIKKATDALHFRGPDSKGVFTDEKVGLGHARLSIIDTSHGASQPFHSEDGRYVLVFNGEIYNFKSLKQPLLSKGVHFKTSSDTEVLLYHLIENGPNGIKDLNGFFAFDLYDRQTKKHLLARDRFGIKPFHIYEDDHQIIFGSEMKAIFQFPIQKELDHSSLQMYFKFNYIPQPYSMLKNCSKLEPGHYLEINEFNTITKHRYYEVEFKENNYTVNSYPEAQKKLREVLEESIEKRMVSDVPLGAFLSGGIDSSVIVSLASKMTQNLNTFSIGYKDEPIFDETKYAKLVADKYKTNHTVFELTNDDLFGQLNQVLEYTDEPFADSSGLAVNILSMNTRKKATVALSGDGADEIFSGYNKHMAEFIARSGGLKNSLVVAGKPIWNLLPKSRNSKLGNLNRQLLRFSDGVKKGNKERYWDWAGILSDDDSSKYLLKTDFNFFTQKKQILGDHLLSSDFNGVLLQDVNQVLVGDMLTKVDMNSMNNSLEVRVPFLDHNVVDFAFSIPESFKIQKGIKKKILQESFKPDLPEELFKRPKHGFEVPLLKWFKGDLHSIIKNEYLNKDFIESQGIFNSNSTDNLLKKLNSSNPEDSAATTWAFIVFQHWWKKWLT